MADGGGINLRLSLKGAEQVRAELASIGPAGSRMAQQLDRAMREPGAGVRALDAGVKSARGNVEGLTGRLGPLGAGLGAIGGVGLAVAAVLAGVAAAAAFAISQARGAVQWADDLEDSAAKIGIGTTALQEWRFAAAEAGATAQDADTAIASFQSKLGDAMAGGRSAKWFERLGFSRSDLQAFESTEAALDAVIDRIAALSSEAERSAVSDKLGLGPLLPLIREGGDAIDEMRQRAQELGVVMDEEMVRRGAAASRELEVLSQIIDLQLKQAFIDLAPAIIEAIGLVADLATQLADAMDQWRSLDERTNRGLRTERTKLQAEKDAIAAQFGTQPLDGQVVVGRMIEGGQYGRVDPRAIRAAGAGPFGSGRTPQLPSASNEDWGLLERRPHRAYLDAGDQFDAATARIAQIDEVLASRASTPQPRPANPVRLHDVSGGGGGSNRDRDAERRQREADRALEQLTRERLEAEKALLQARFGPGGTEPNQTELDLALNTIKVEQQAAEREQLRATLAAGGRLDEVQQARLDELKAMQDAAASAEDEAILRDEALHQAEIRNEIEDRALSLQTEILSLASSGARTAEERRRIELELLEIAQRRRRAEEALALQAETDPGLRASREEYIARLPELEARERDRVLESTAGPIERWRNQLPRDAAEYRQLMEEFSIDALDDVNRGLRDAWLNADNAGDAFDRMGKVAVDALNGIVDKLLELALNKWLIEPLVNGLFGEGGGAPGAGGGGGWLNAGINAFSSWFAGGGKMSAGPTGGKGFAWGGMVGATGLYPVGERGLELAELPVGTRIHDTERTEALLRTFNRPAQTAAASAWGGGQALNLTLVNKGEPMKATASEGAGGQPIVTLEPARQMVRGVVREMGTDGSLVGSLGLTPRPRRRG